LLIPTNRRKNRFASAVVQAYCNDDNGAGREGYLNAKKTTTTREIQEKERQRKRIIIIAAAVVVVVVVVVIFEYQQINNEMLTLD